MTIAGIKVEYTRTDAMSTFSITRKVRKEMIDQNINPKIIISFDAEIGHGYGYEDAVGVCRKYVDMVEKESPA